MAHILSNSTAAELQLVCRVHRHDGVCDAGCPLKHSVCGEQVVDWPVVPAEAEVED